MYENQGVWDIRPVSIHVIKVCSKSKIPIFIGWFILVNKMLLIDILMVNRIWLMAENSLI